MKSDTLHAVTLALKLDQHLGTDARAGEGTRVGTRSRLEEVHYVRQPPLRPPCPLIDAVGETAIARNTVRSRAFERFCHAVNRHNLTMK